MTSLLLVMTSLNTKRNAAERKKQRSKTERRTMTSSFQVSGNNYVIISSIMTRDDVILCVAHTNYIGASEDLGPVIISIADSPNAKNLRTFIRSKKVREGKDKRERDKGRREEKGEERGRRKRGTRKRKRGRERGKER